MFIAAIGVNNYEINEDLNNCRFPTACRIQTNNRCWLLRDG